MWTCKMNLDIVCKNLQQNKSIQCCMLAVISKYQKWKLVIFQGNRKDLWNNLVAKIASSGKVGQLLFSTTMCKDRLGNDVEVLLVSPFGINRMQSYALRRQHFWGYVRIHECCSRERDKPGRRVSCYVIDGRMQRQQ